MSSITVTFSADSVEELHVKIREYATATLPTLEELKNEVTEVVEEKSKSVTKPKKDEKPAEKKQEVSTDSTSDTKPSKTGEAHEPTEKATVKQEEPEKSITVGQYPNATKADVQAAMKNAMAKKKRDAILTAFGRFNAGKLSDLKEEDYSAFITDLEALVGE